MPERSTTPDAVELWQAANEAFLRRDFDAWASLYDPDVVWEARPLGMIFEGRAATRRHIEEWAAGCEEYQIEEIESHDLGNDVSFHVSRHDARPLGTRAMVHEQWAFAIQWHVRTIVRVIAHQDINEARATAKQLAEPKR
jgi:ketosteroid isomerase-like protein